MEPFVLHSNLIMACHFTGIYDVNRTTTLPDNDYSLVKEWVDSIKNQDLCGLLFHNNLSEETCSIHQNKNVQFVKVKHNPVYNPNIYRYFVYRNYLRETDRKIKNLFITDVSDVVMIQNPFIKPLFFENPASLFCGDEEKFLDNEWMAEHSAHLRSKIDDYLKYEIQFKTEKLLNCGIIGGNIEIMQPFLEKLCTIHEQFNSDNKTGYTGDMGAFNYLARTQFNSQLIFGEPVNTKFKSYETNRADCWFRHK
jgi:hypothetical protein